MKTTQHTITLLTLLSAFTFHPSALLLAQPPALINYQGRLLNGTNLVNGNVGLSLRLFNVTSGGTALYEDSNTVAVVDGSYATFLGDNTTAGSLVGALTNPAVFVEVAVNGVALSPRERVGSVAYSMATRGLLLGPNGNVVMLPNVNDISNAANYAVIGGGRTNVIGDAQYAVISGGRSNTIGDLSNASTIGGGEGNQLGYQAEYATVGGGLRNRLASGSFGGAIAGGAFNAGGANSTYASIGGGITNTVGNGVGYATIGGGNANNIGFNSIGGTIGGGSQNRIGTNTEHGVIGGGLINVIWENARYATIAGGWDNWVRGDGGMIPGGYACLATNYAFAAGRQAKAIHAGAFVWGDSTAADVSSASAKSVTFRAAGGYRLFSNDGLSLGAQLPPNATAWAALSDRNAKENFAPIDTAAILDQVAELPMTAWTYKADPEQRRYIGPVAQDFHAAFGLGDDTTINTLDTDGVALAAIQALAKRYYELGMMNDELKRENEALRTEVEAIKRKLGM
jgi:hypothetical protein